MSTESTPIDFTSAFDDWIAGATISKRSVPIYGKPGLYAEYQELERELAVAEEVEKAGGGSELADSAVGRIHARMTELYDEWVASKSTWTVRALSVDERAGLDAADDTQGLPALSKPTRDPEPVKPDPLPDRHTEQQAKSHTVAMSEYATAQAAWDAEAPAFDEATAAYADEVNLRGIAKAVERVEFADGRVQSGVTVAQLRVLRERLGERQVMSLLSAALLADAEEPEIPAPFSRSRASEDARTS